MILPRLGALASIFATGVYAACSSNLLVDDFSEWSSSNRNKLDHWRSDDGSMNSISASGGVLNFTPNSKSYFYEVLECEKATNNGYDAISFEMQGPVGASFRLEIQTHSSCSSDSYDGEWFKVEGLSGSVQTFVIPFSSWPKANQNAIRAFVWATWSDHGVAWNLSNIQLVCSAAGNTSQPAVSSTPQKSSTVRSSSKATTTSQPATELTSITTLSTVPPKTSSIATKTTSTPSPPGSAGCTTLLIDDWESQSRLTFLYYNAMHLSSSDDGTMKSIVVSNNKVTLTPQNTQSYFYTQLGCMNVASTYGGISLRIKAAAGSTMHVQLGAPKTCGGGDDTQFATLTAAQLGWRFDGTEKLYTIPFAKFTGFDLTKVNTVLIQGLSRPVTFGPMALYCGATISEYIITPDIALPVPTSTVAAPAGTASPLVIDTFKDKDTNNLGFWHGEDEGITTTFGSSRMTIKTNDSDLAWYSQISETCADITAYQDSYLHITYSGSNKFSIALQQHNSLCDENIAPYPETWDSLEVARYSTATDIYMPISHFNIELSRVMGLALKGFYTLDPTVLTKIEIVPTIPDGFKIPNKLPSGNLVFACKRPNSFAFAIDDGDPTLAQEVMEIVRSENINVTFFTVGAPLDDPSTNLSTLYRDMRERGHQIALHSFTHPKMEGLPSDAAIDWEYTNDIETVSQVFDGLHTPYFRPPFGTEGARMRQRLSAALGTDNPYLVMWSVDVEDWLWAETKTPEKQLEAFKRDLAKGGSLVVMHYLYPSTVGYLRQFIQLAKATGKQLMRVDQCMMDPNAPPL